MMTECGAMLAGGIRLFAGHTAASLGASGVVLPDVIAWLQPVWLVLPVAVLAVGYGLEIGLRALLTPVYLAGHLLGLGSQDEDEIPVPRASISGLLKMLLDEVFFTTEAVSTDMASAADCERIQAEIGEALELFGRRGWLDAPARYHQTPPSLVSPVMQREESRGVPFLHMQFESGYEPHAGEPGAERWLAKEANRTAHAWLLQHPDRPRPWLVCVHGYRMGIPLLDFIAFRSLWLHHRLGLNVMMPILPLHGPRSGGRRSGEGFLTGDFLDTVHVQAQAMWDLRRILGWIRAQDPAAIGVYGLSLGGYTAALLASLEADLDCVIAGIPATDFLRLARAHIPSLGMPVATVLQEMADEIGRLMRVVSPLVLTPAVPWDRRFLFAGMSDRLVPADHVRDLWRHWERPRLLWYEGSHVSFNWEAQVRGFVSDALRATGFTGNFKDRPLAARA